MNPSPLTFGKVKDPCGDCWDGHCTMNCYPRERLPDQDPPLGWQEQTSDSDRICTCTFAIDSCAVHGRGSDKGQPGD